MGILSSIFGNNKKLPINKTYRFKRIKSEFEISIGDEVNIWNKPNTKQLNLYAYGSVGGNGLVGTIYDSIISYHLNNTENLFVKNKIVGLTNDSIDLFISMYTDKKAVEKIQQNYKTEWIKKLNKKYNPKSTWEIRFFSEEKIGKNDFLIQTIDKCQIEEYYQKDEQSVWLTDKNGNRLPAENKISSSGTERTLRAVFSGYELEVVNFKKENFWYYIEIGINK